MASQSVLSWSRLPCGASRSHTLPGARVIQIFGEDLDHLFERGDQLLAQFALARLDHLQLLLGAFVNGPNATNEHLGHVVASPHAHLTDQCQDQRVALGGQQILHVARIERRGHVGHVLELGRRHAVEQRIAVRQGLEPGQLVQQQIEVLARGLFRGPLDLVVQRAPGRQFGGQQPIKPVSLGQTQALGDLLVQGGLGGRMRLLGDFVEGAKHRQFVAQPHQFLDRDVDDVDAGFHDAGGLLGKLNGQLARLPIGIGLHPEQFAYRFVVAVQRGQRCELDPLGRRYAQGG